MNREETQCRIIPKLDFWSSEGLGCRQIQNIHTSSGLFDLDLEQRLDSRT